MCESPLENENRTIGVKQTYDPSILPLVMVIVAGACDDLTSGHGIT